MFMINYEGSIRWMKDLENDSVYVKIRKVKDMASDKDLIILQDTWLLQDFLEHYSKAEVQPVPDNPEKIVLTRDPEVVWRADRLVLPGVGAFADCRKGLDALDGMVQAHVAWVPTLDIYEASRDLQRAQNQPWFAEYLHPALAEYFQPNPRNHGSYFIGWTSTDETFWKENYRLWMAALRDFDRRGGLIGMGDDAGFIYQMYGFGLIRGMELHQEAGFNPIKIIQQATGNNARILGQEERLGRVRAGFAADLIVVNGNPLENLKVLYPTGTEEIRNGKTVHTGGIEWTVKDGIPYHVPTLMAQVKDMVAGARAAAH